MNINIYYYYDITLHWEMKFLARYMHISLIHITLMVSS